jgi:hypothetical protein
VGAHSARIGDSLRKKIASAAKALVLEIDKNLRKVTPVDTGHARANWVPSVGTPHETEVESTSKVGSAEHSAGVTKVLAYKLEQGALYVSNNVPYIRTLNYGHSKQAPAAFIEFAVDQALRTVKADLAQYLNTEGLLAANSMSAFATLDKVGGFGAQGAENVASAYSPFGGDD